MIYTIVVDKQPKTNPSQERREYHIDINELHYKDDVYDTLTIEKDKVYITRRLSLSKYHVLSVLEEPQIEELEDKNIQLFEGDNYIYLEDMVGNKIYAEYLIKNDFTDLYITTNEMNSAINQTASKIEFNVNQKLESYNTSQELKAAIKIVSDAINLEVSKKLNKDEFSTQLTIDYESVKIAWNRISEYIQFINGELQIKDSNKKLLMALAKDGQHFYKSNGKEIGKIGLISENNKNYLAFSLKAENTNDGMAWGIEIDNKFYPVFELTKFGVEGGTYGGILTMISMLYMANNPIKLMDSYLYGDIGNTVELMDTNSFNILDTNGNITFYVSDSRFLIFNYANGYNNSVGGKTILLFPSSGLGQDAVDFNNARLMGMYNVPTTDGDLNYLAGGSGDNGYIYAGFKDGSYVSIYKNSSDKKLKKNISKTNTKAIDKIKQIKHKQFDWKQSNQHQEVGYIAQEMKKIDNTFVHYQKLKCQDGTEKEDWQINLLSVLATATKAIQEQQEQIEELQKRIDKLEAK